MEVVTREKFISSHQETHSLPEGLTIDEMLASISWSRELHQWTYVSIGGREVPAEFWKQVRPKQGHQILVALRPAGGGGGGGGSGKQILTAVAAVAIAVVAWYAAPAIVGAFAGVSAATASATMGTAVALTQAGLAIAGTLALGALVKPGRLGAQTLTNSGSAGNGPQESATYGVSGAQNAINRYGVVPRVYGRHRVTPPMAAEPYVVSSGTTQTINILLDFGYGPLLVEDIRIGNTPITQFPTARWWVHPNFLPGQALQFYQNDQSTLQVGAILAEGTNNVRVVPQDGSFITLEFQFPNGLIRFNEQGGSFQQNENVAIFAAPAGGTYQPIADFHPYALFGGEGGVQTAGPVQQGSVGIVRWSRGTTSGLPQGFTSSDPAVLQMQIGSTLTYNGVQYTILGISDTPGEPGDRVVELSAVPPDVSWIYTNTGIIPGQEGWPGTFILPGSAGTFGPLWVTFGPGIQDVAFHGQTRTPRTISICMQMPYESEWQVLVVRTSPVSTSQLVANQIIWSTLRSSRGNMPIAPRKGRTIMEVQVTASEQISGQVQNINALCTSILYDPRLNAWVPTRNPAWVYADILTGSANPRAVPWSQLDVPKLIEFANKCDALTVQGDIFATCDMVVDFRTTIGELSQTVCSAGRAAPAMLDGLYSVFLEDEDRDPVQMFTNRNASNFSATRSWVDQPHALNVKYLSEWSWDRQELVVYADGYDALNATKFETLELMGITRAPQAWRFGRYFLAAATLRRERLSIQTDVENLVCQRGDLVRIAHDRLLQNFAARARVIESAVIEMDAFLVTEMFSNSFFINEANTGVSGWPTGWSGGNLTPPAIGFAWLGRGVDERGRAYLDIRMAKAAAGGSTNSYSIWPTIFMGEVNSDDQIVSDWEVELLDQVNFVSDYIRINTQPTNSTGGTGLGSPNALKSWPSVGERKSLTDSKILGSTLGLVNGWRPNIEFAWQPTTDYPCSMDIRIFTPRFWINNPKPSLLSRVEDAGVNTIPNAAAAGAVLGVLGSGGALPTGWFLGLSTGWTCTIARIDQVWEYWDFDIRIQAPAGTGSLVITLNPSQDLPVSKIVYGSVQLRRVALTGTAAPVYLRMTARTAGDVHVADFTTAALSLNTTNETRQVTGAANFTAHATAAKYRFSIVVTPAPGDATDMTIRIRLPLAGASDPATDLPAVPNAEAIYCQLRTQDGVLTDSLPILARPAEDEIMLADSDAALVSPGDVLAIGTLDTETSDWLVDKITPGPDFAANIEFIEYAPAVLDADKGPIPPYVPANGNGILVDLPPVRNLMMSSTLYIYTTDGVPNHTILLQWDPPSFQVAFYIVSRLYVVADPGMGVSPPYQSENVLLEIARVQNTEYVDTIDTRTLRRAGTTLRYFVVPVSVSGRRGESEDVEDIFFPDTTPPPAVVFNTNVLSETTMLIWERPNIPDLAGYQVRFIDQTWAPVNPSWEQMVSAVDSISPGLTSLTVHIQTGIYAIRAFDTSGNFGPPSYSLTKVELLPHVDEVTRLTEGPTWTGTFDRTVIVDDELRLATDLDGNYYSTGWFYSDSAVSYDDSWLFRVRGAFESYSFPVGPDPEGDWNAQIWVAIQREAPKLDSPWFDPLTTADPLAGGVGVYIPLGNVAQTDLVGRLINWAVRLTSNRVDLTPSVVHATLIVDHSERTEFGDDVPTGTGGLNIPFSSPFFTPPTAAVTLNNGQSGDRIVKSTSTTALTVEVFNAAGTSVDRSIDWQVIGYGRGI
jgi:hypothetical protein